MTDLTLVRPLPGTEHLDGRLRDLDRSACERATEFRGPGMELDRNPDAISGYLHLEGVRMSWFSHIPARYRPPLDLPSELLDASQTCRGVAVVWERMAYGDAGMMLAAPGPSLSGGVVNHLGDQDQRDRFFTRLAATPVTTFFGLTEAAKGSAATELETTLTPAPDGEGWLLNGAKCYIGNGARAQVGVVFCRRAPGPLGIEAVLVDTSAPGFSGELLHTVGLRGARISRIRFTDMYIPRTDLLGAALRPTRRGLRGAQHVLYRARPGIASMALGSAQAACDYLRLHRPALPKYDRLRFEDLLDRIAATRRMTHTVAADNDEDLVNVHRIGAVKAHAAALSQDATLLAAELLGPASLLEHPWLEKLYRDVRAFEIMEGPPNLHRLSAFRGVLKDTFLRPRA